MAQAGIAPDAVGAALKAAAEIVREALGRAG
jgi:hypothetical protein